MHYLSRPGGLEVLMPTIINELKDRKIKVFVIRPKPENEETVYKDNPVEIKYGSKNTFIAVIKFLMYVLKDRDGIYHLFNTGPHFLFVLRLLNVKKIIYSIHGTIYWKTKWQKLVLKRVWKWSITNKMVFTSNSDYSAQKFRELVNETSETITLYNPINNSRFNLNNRVESGAKLRIVFVGRLYKGKNLEDWINTAAFLLKEGVNAEFEIYGTGPHEVMLRKQIQDLKLEGKIILKGYKREIEEIYKNADLLMFLSGYESFGNVVVESILCGTPVLTFDIPSMKEIFRDYPDFLVQRNSEYQQQIYSKIEQISELKSLAMKASSNFAQRFSSVSHIHKLESIYNGLA